MQLLAGIVFMALAAIVPAWVAVLVYAIALGAAVIGLISAETVVEEIHLQDAKLKKDVTLMRSLQSKISQIAAQSEDAAIKALAEEFRYSDPVSSDAIADAETDLAAAKPLIAVKISEIETEIFETETPNCVICGLTIEPGDNGSESTMTIKLLPEGGSAENMPKTTTKALTGA